MNKKGNIFRPSEKIMFIIVFIVLFLMYYFGSGYSFFNSIFLSAGFTLLCLIIRVLVFKLAKKISKE